MTKQKLETRSSQRTIADLAFVGLNSRVFALDRYTGELVWQWKSPEGTGYVFVLLDGDRLIVSVMGYIYCLDPVFGQEVWRNPLKGFGVGVTSLATAHGQSNPDGAAIAHLQQQRAAQQTVIT